MWGVAWLQLLPGLLGVGEVGGGGGQRGVGTAVLLRWRAIECPAVVIVCDVASLVAGCHVVSSLMHHALARCLARGFLRQWLPAQQGPPPALAVWTERWHFPSTHLNPPPVAAPVFFHCSSAQLQPCRPFHAPSPERVHACSAGAQAMQPAQRPGPPGPLAALHCTAHTHPISTFLARRASLRAPSILSQGSPLQGPALLCCSLEFRLPSLL